MAPTTGDAIADLRSLLEECCGQLAGLSAAELLRTLEGESPPAAAAPLERPGGEGGSRASAEAILEGTAGPRWQPLLVGLPPGVEGLLGTVKPPLTAIVALLGVLRAFLQLLNALLIAIPDPFFALIFAAYKALQSLINDLLNTGAYLYYDAPGFTSNQVSLAELGLARSPSALFHAGQSGEDAPIFPVDGFERWIGRFAASFDDPGDDARPILSPGASVEAVFIVGAAPTLEALSQLVWLLGQLLNIDAFKRAVDRFHADSPDRGKTRVDQQAVAPDWQSRKLPQLLPQLEPLRQVPELLLGLMAKLQSAVDLLADLSLAIQQKVRLLQSLAEMIQTVIDLLDALQSAGLHILPVATTEGVTGLRQAFVRANNRPEGGYLCGVCLLAAGPGLKDAQVLWEILCGKALEKAGEQAAERFGGALETLERDGQSGREAFNALVDAVETLPRETLASLGQSAEELRDGLLTNPAEVVELLAETDAAALTEALREGVERARESLHPGPRSLSLAFGAPPPTRDSPSDVTTASDTTRNDDTSKDDAWNEEPLPRSGEASV
jgi:hypothetical protein